MSQVDDSDFESIKLNEDDYRSEYEVEESPTMIPEYINTKRKNLEKFLGLKDVGPGIPSKEAIEKAAVESVVYQGLAFDRDGRKNLSDLLGVSDSDNKQPIDTSGPFFSFLKNAKHIGGKVLKYKRNTDSLIPH